MEQIYILNVLTNFQRIKHNHDTSTPIFFFIKYTSPPFFFMRSADLINLVSFEGSPSNGRRESNFLFFLSNFSLNSFYTLLLYHSGNNTLFPYDV